MDKAGYGDEEEDAMEIDMEGIGLNEVDVNPVGMAGVQMQK